LTYNLARHIGTELAVRQVARRLSAYAYAETRLMEAQAGWLVSIPLAEDKIELGYHLFEDANHADGFRARLPELGDFSGMPKPPDERLAIFFDELTNADDLVERYIGLFRVVRPALIALYEAQIEASDAVADAPTVRLLRRALENHRSALAWGEGRLAALDVAGGEAWEAHLRALLIAAGGLTGEASPGNTPMRRYPQPLKRFRSAPPVRDSRFHIAAYERHEGRAATDVWDEDSLLKYWFMMVEGELEVLEACGRTLFDFPDAPWELRLVLARQLWDEGRHAELSLQRFAELGGKLDMLPVRDTFPLYFDPIRNTDLAKRLAHINQVVEGWVTDDFAMMVDICRALGDERSARLFDQLITDEWLHIKIGADWIPRLTADNASYRQEVIRYRLETERKIYAGLDAAARETARRFTKEKP